MIVAVVSKSSLLIKADVTRGQAACDTITQQPRGRAAFVTTAVNSEQAPALVLVM